MESPTDQNLMQPDEPMLTAIEARVLGALMEKQLTTPDAYPITLNSLVLACNQKTSREPVTNYESGELQRCASQLQDKNWITVDYSARAARYDQRLTRVLGLDKAAQALLNVMLLRGPQTLSELFTRTQRMFDFENINAVEEKLEHLCAKTTPYFVRIPRAAGQREDRFMHLLCGKPDLDAISAMQSAKNTSHANDESTVYLEQKVVHLEQQLELMQKQIKFLLDLNGVSDSDIN
ncbi:UPF0502 protein [Cellvibrio zantedeschiae]|uniref:UPF0502 protein n=1 Tax=Cellvibrio zantedeschiae TaxID=1237077 RepID=A0ABQ3B022_9GAMM|nr:YceH family protein [Cellvibrio zantedeschiae]GGY72197.1 UPF0502 protein [Cellvibrio zantedeschiae]